MISAGDSVRINFMTQKLSQSALAEMVGVSRNTISSIETGQFSPTAKLALILCLDAGVLSHVSDRCSAHGRGGGCKKETAVSKYGISVKAILKRTVFVYNKFCFFNLYNGCFEGFIIQNKINLRIFYLKQYTR